MLINDFMSDSFLTNERAIQSTLCSIEKIASFMSLSVSAGLEISVLGRLKPFR